MSKNSLINNLQCAFCKNKTDLNQLLQVDSLVQDMDSEQAEFIWDQLPKIGMGKRNIEKFSHMSNLGYKILNVCMKCYQKALSSHR